MFKKPGLLIFNLVLSIVGLCFPAIARAQFLGYTGLQTVTQVLANGTTCTGSAQNFVTSNLGQTSHIATATSTAINFQMEIDGQDKLGNVFRLSDLQVGTPTSAKGGLVVTASGYMPIIQISVTCSSGAIFSVSYSGSFSPQPPSVAGALLVATDKLPFQTAPANATASTTFQAPSGNSGGTLIFQYSGTGPSGSSLTAQCLSNSGSNLQAFTFQLSTTSSAQLFQVSQVTCPFVTLTYTSGGASAVTYNLEYVFNQSGTLQTLSTGNSGPSSTLPIQVASDASSQAFTIFGSTINPNGADLLAVNANSGSRTLYFDKIYISNNASTAVVVNLNTTNTVPTGCTVFTPANLKIGSSVTSTASSGFSCTGGGTVVSTFAVVVVGPASTLVVDARGVIAPAGGNFGISAVTANNVTGTVYSTAAWYEK